MRPPATAGAAGSADPRNRSANPQTAALEPLESQGAFCGLPKDRPLAGQSAYCFSSFHPNGVHFLLADGSARLVAETIQQSAFLALCTRANNDVADSLY